MGWIWAEGFENLGCVVVVENALPFDVSGMAGSGGSGKEEGTEGVDNLLGVD